MRAEFLGGGGDAVGSTHKGPVVTGWDTLQEQQTGSDVAGGERAGGAKS